MLVSVFFFFCTARSCRKLLLLIRKKSIGILPSHILTYPYLFTALDFELFKYTGIFYLALDNVLLKGTRKVCVCYLFLHSHYLLEILINVSRIPFASIVQGIAVVRNSVSLR